MAKTNWKLIYYVAVIGLGGAVQGVDIGIIATVLGQETFNSTMFPPGTKNVSSLVGAIVAISQAGIVLGSAFNGLLLEKLGRRWTLMISTFFTIVGAILQTAANGVALMIVGRCISGIALGVLTPTSPIYISELSPPHERARMVGIFGFMIASGFCLANWIGYGCSFATGNLSWRLSLAMQIPLAAVIMALALTLPESPRWLAQKERYEDFKASMRRLYAHQDEAAILRAEAEVQAQLHLEASQRTHSGLGHAFLELFNRKNIARTAVAIVVMQIIVFSGALAIQNYQTILYASLGFEGQQALLISGAYGFMGVVGQMINIYVIADRWPRVRTMWVGCFVLASALSILMALSKFYGSGGDINGARAGIAFIFIHSVIYAAFFNSTIFAISSEYFPLYLRGYGASVAFLCEGITAIWLSQLVPIAFDAISWKFYSVFISVLASFGIFFAFFLKETNQQTLESIAGNFGDMTVSMEKIGAIGIENAHATGMSTGTHEHRPMSVELAGISERA